jgi:hypothetical protein
MTFDVMQPSSADVMQPSSAKAFLDTLGKIEEYDAILLRHAKHKRKWTVSDYEYARVLTMRHPETGGQITGITVRHWRAECHNRKKGTRKKNKNINIVDVQKNSVANVFDREIALVAEAMRKHQAAVKEHEAELKQLEKMRARVCG